MLIEHQPAIHCHHNPYHHYHYHQHQDGHHHESHRPHASLCVGSALHAPSVAVSDLSRAMVHVKDAAHEGMMKAKVKKQEQVRS
jgi:hypothetical protein